jgi:Asp-tRNA(Asn)/Glu-tRNA(Gln) amidotransferase A subunit family amidase
VELSFAITFTGRHHGESELLAVAHAFQRATGVHIRRTPLGNLAAEK